MHGISPKDELDYWRAEAKRWQVKAEQAEATHIAIVTAARAWRVGRSRDIVGTAPSGGQRSATGAALIDAIDGAKFIDDLIEEREAWSMLSDDELAKLVRLNKERIDDSIVSSSYTSAWEVLRAARELRERRAADLTAEDVEALTWVKAVIVNHAHDERASETHRRAIAALDKLIETRKP
jgi:hypothetical protein